MIVNTTRSPGFLLSTWLNRSSSVFDPPAVHGDDQVHLGAIQRPVDEAAPAEDRFLGAAQTGPLGGAVRGQPGDQQAVLQLVDAEDAAVRPDHAAEIGGRLITARRLESTPTRRYARVNGGGVPLRAAARTRETDRPIANGRNGSTDRLETAQTVFPTDWKRRKRPSPADGKREKRPYRLGSRI